MNKMEKHVTVVAALQVGFGILGILIGCFVFFLLTGIGVASEEEEAFVVLSTVGTLVGGLLFICSVPAVVGGIGLFARKSWARILVLIVAALGLLNVPIGTLLGIYTIWVLVQDETAQLFQREPTAAEAQMVEYPEEPPAV